MAPRALLPVLLAAAMLLPATAPAQTAPVPTPGLEGPPALAAVLAAAAPSTPLAGLALAGLVAGEALAAAEGPSAALAAVGPLLAAHGALGPGPADAGALARVAGMVRAFEAGPPSVGAAWDLSGGRGTVGLPDTGDDVLAALRRLAPAQALPAVPRFAGPLEALDALALELLFPLGPEDQEALAPLAALPPASAEALTRIVEAALLQQRATRLAFADPAGPDLGLLLAARAEVAERVLGAAPGLAAAGGPTLCLPAFVALDLDGLDTAYPGSCSVALLVDVGGNDTYRNNAGGGNLRAALLLDLAGDDRYLPAVAGAVTGGGNQGAGFLADLDGDDQYVASSTADLAANGGGIQGSGFLYDAAGRDRYDGRAVRGALNGAGWLGLGLLWDESGDDTYAAALTGSVGAANGGGAIGGVGLLVDRAGDDRYTADAAGDAGANGGAVTGVGALLDLAGDDVYGATIAGEGGANGGSTQGAALLYDAAGDDAYTVRLGSGGANGGATDGAGILVDLSGDDRYDALLAAAGGANGGSQEGLGVLYDGAGDDVYAATLMLLGGANGGGSYGTGLLYDAAGSDVYVGRAPVAGGVNGGALSGLGLLVDRRGTNLFDGLAPGGGANGAAGGVGLSAGGQDVSVPRGLGILLAGPGDDTYAGAGVTQGAAVNYSAGLLFDEGGANTFLAGPGLAQGAGRNAGLGLLVDRGWQSHFRLLDLTAGQGTGLQGVGLLLRPSNVSTAVYEAAPSARASALGGAGVGLRVDRGVFELLGTPPALTCASPALVDQTVPVGAVLLRLRLCPSDATTRENVTLPFLGPVPRVPKANPCVFLAAVCAIVAQALGEDARGWLTRPYVDVTVSGGLAALAGRELVGGVERPEEVRVKGVQAEADRACDLGCRMVTV